MLTERKGPTQRWERGSRWQQRAIGAPLTFPLTFAAVGFVTNLVLTIGLTGPDIRLEILATTMGTSLGFMLGLLVNILAVTYAGAPLTSALARLPLDQAQQIHMTVIGLLESLSNCHNNRFFGLEATAELERVTDNLRLMANGTCELSRDPMRILRFGEQVQRSLWGVTDQRDAGWWASSGRKFHELNLRLGEDPNVDVRRIFICDGTELDQVLQEQQAAGVHCTRIQWQDCPEDLRGENFTIFDGKVVHWDKVDPVDHRTVLHHFSHNKKHLDHYSHLFMRHQR